MSGDVRGKGGGGLCLGTEIQKLEERRAPQGMECIYILTPDEFAVKCLISDFNRPKPRYTAAHLLWTSGKLERAREGMGGC